MNQCPKEGKMSLREKETGVCVGFVLGGEFHQGSASCTLVDEVSMHSFLESWTASSWSQSVFLQKNKTKSIFFLFSIEKQRPVGSFFRCWEMSAGHIAAGAWQLGVL